MGSASVAVLDAFHVVKLGTTVVDEVRRRVQQDTLGHRGHRDDPLYKIHGLLCRGSEAGRCTFVHVTLTPSQRLHASD